jgi:hypothetical protein
MNKSHIATMCWSSCAEPRPQVSIDVQAWRRGQFVYYRDQCDLHACNIFSSAGKEYHWATVLSLFGSTGYNAGQNLLNEFINPSKVYQKPINLSKLHEPAGICLLKKISVVTRNTGFQRVFKILCQEKTVCLHAWYFIITCCTLRHDVLALMHILPLFRTHFQHI